MLGTVINSILISYKVKYMKVNALLIGMAMMAFTAGAQQTNPMAEAVIKQYSEILAENPKDYITLVDRATEYFNLGNYDRALSDVEMALEYTPEKESAYKEAEYNLMADIYMAKKNYDKALQAVDAWLKINPSSQNGLYKLGNLNLLMNNPSAAYTAFDRLQRLSPRSQEAFYGMAKANVMMNKYQESEDLIKEIESLGKGSFLTYCRIGDLYADMNKTSQATGNYLVAYMMNQNAQRPLESLKFLSKKDKAGVLNSIDGYITANPDNVGYLYIKALIGEENKDYLVTEEACNEILNKVDEEAPAIYRMLAMAQKALNKPKDAATNIKFAENFAPNNQYVLVDKADILLASDPKGALEAAEKALSLEPNMELGLMIGAKAAILVGDKDKGLEYLNDIILTNPANAEALLLRGFLNETIGGNKKASEQDYTRAGNIKTDNMEDEAWVALGKFKAGKKLDSDGIINDLISKVGNNEDILYNIAVYFAQTGNTEKAKEYRDKASNAGYSNVYNLNANREPLFNLSPLY